MCHFMGRSHALLLGMGIALRVGMIATINQEGTMIDDTLLAHGIPKSRLCDCRSGAMGLLPGGF